MVIEFAGKDVWERLPPKFFASCSPWGFSWSGRRSPLPSQLRKQKPELLRLCARSLEASTNLPARKLFSPASNPLWTLSPNFGPTFDTKSPRRIQFTCKFSKFTSACWGNFHKLSALIDSWRSHLVSCASLKITSSQLDLREGCTTPKDQERRRRTFPHAHATICSHFHALKCAELWLRLFTCVCSWGSVACGGM